MATKKYSDNAQDKIGEVMHEFKEGTLKSSSGEKVTNRKQAVAIGISEAREEGLKTPPEKSSAIKSSAKSAGSKTTSKTSEAKSKETKASKSKKA